MTGHVQKSLRASIPPNRTPPETPQIVAIQLTPRPTPESPTIAKALTKTPRKKLPRLNSRVQNDTSKQVNKLRDKNPRIERSSVKSKRSRATHSKSVGDTKKNAKDARVSWENLSNEKTPVIILKSNPDNKTASELPRNYLAPRSWSDLETAEFKLTMAALTEETPLQENDVFAELSTLLEPDSTAWDEETAALFSELDEITRQSYEPSQVAWNLDKADDVAKSPKRRTKIQRSGSSKQVLEEVLLRKKDVSLTDAGKYLRQLKTNQVSRLSPAQINKLAKKYFTRSANNAFELKEEYKVHPRKNGVNHSLLGAEIDRMKKENEISKSSKALKLNVRKDSPSNVKQSRHKKKATRAISVAIPAISSSTIGVSRNTVAQNSPSPQRSLPPSSPLPPLPTTPILQQRSSQPPSYTPPSAPYPRQSLPPNTLPTSAPTKETPHRRLNNN